MLFIMKTFLNVLYRRILYKIPLKFLLVLLAILAVFVASVKAENLPASWRWWNNIQTDGSYWYSTQRINITSTRNFTVNNYDFTCFHKSTQDASCVYSQDWWTNRVLTSLTSLSCVDTSTFTIKWNCWDTYFFYFKVWQWIIPNNTMSSLECQTEYNLIPISSVDQNYCTTNNLCPTCQVCPVWSWSISTLYINDILHVWSPFIYMNIPEEIWRDYAYTQGGTNMFIDVEGYNVDYEAVQDIIDQQNYKPTQEDFQNIIALLGPYWEIIIFFVFLFIVWAWIKKPFKSKL